MPNVVDLTVVSRARRVLHNLLDERGLGFFLLPTSRVPRLDSTPTDISVELDGQLVPAKAGEPVACSLWAAGEKVFSRSIKYHRPRGPFCFSGACSQCLMRVDGVPNVHTCRTPAAPGMRLERQNAFPSASLDLFGLTDWLFPRGMNHHEMFAGIPGVSQAVLVSVRRSSSVNSGCRTCAWK